MKTLAKVIGLTTLLGLTLGAFAQEAQAVDELFVTAATEGNLYEIQSSELALESASSEDVQSYAQMMVEDHTRLGEAMTQVATELGVTPPTEPGAAQQLMLAQLSGLEGAAFDQAYLMQQVMSHQMEISLFEIAVQDAQNEQLTAFAQENLPSLQAHLQAAQSLMQQGGMTGGGMTGGSTGGGN